MYKWHSSEWVHPWALSSFYVSHSGGKHPQASLLSLPREHLCQENTFLAICLGLRQSQVLQRSAWQKPRLHSQWAEPAPSLQPAQSLETVTLHSFFLPEVSLLYRTQKGSLGNACSFIHPDTIFTKRAEKNLAAKTGPQMLDIHTHTHRPPICEVPHRRSCQ